MKKAIIISIGCILLLLFIVLVPNEVAELKNAVVNSENGDIAFAYADYTGRTAMLRVTLCSKDGTVLFSKKISTDLNNVGIAFVKSNVYVCVGRIEHKTYCFNRSGNAMDFEFLSKEFIHECDAFDGWDFSFGKRTCAFGEYKYQYNTPTFFKHSAKLTVRNEENITTIYESP